MVENSWPTVQESPVGLTRWSLRSYCLVKMFNIKITATGCHTTARKAFAVCEGSVQRTSAKNPIPFVAFGILLCRSWRRSSFNRRAGWKGGRIFWARSFFGWVFATLGRLLLGDRAEWSSFVPWWWGHASDGGELGRLLRSGAVWQLLDPIWDLFVEITHAHSRHTHREYSYV